MKKRIISLILAMMMVFSFIILTSCKDDNNDDKPNLPIGGDDTGNENEGNSITAPDGSTVELPESVTKVVTVSTAAQSIFATVGVSDKIVANFDPAEDCTSEVINAAPEVVIYDFDAVLDVDKLKSEGIVTIVLPEATSMAIIKNHITFVGKMFGINTTSIVDSITKAFTSLQSATKEWAKLDVYIELGSSEDGYISAAPYSYVYEIVSSAGGNNIFGESSGKEGFITVSADEILAADPDVIFTVGSVDDIMNREGWSECSAVKSAQVYTIENLNPSNDAVTAAQTINDYLQNIMYADK